jgi:hypothetical protein
MFAHIFSLEGRVYVDYVGDNDIMPLEGIAVDIDTQRTCTDEGCVDGGMRGHIFDIKMDKYLPLKGKRFFCQQQKNP